jgi:hypothetical protein
VAYIVLVGILASRNRVVNTSGDEEDLEENEAFAAWLAFRINSPKKLSLKVYISKLVMTIGLLH